MNRENESHFTNLPKINISRSRFDRSHSHKTTFEPQVIVPIMVDDTILPGDTIQLDLGAIIRETTPIFPVMDNSRLDVMAFFIPHRLLWSHFKQFYGENDDVFSTRTEYEIPQITAPANGWKEGSLADYFGLPTKVGNYSVTALPFRAYCKVCGDWFRDENLMATPYFPLTDATVTGTNGDGADEDEVNALYKGGLLYKSSRFKDYFGGALPFAQKGPEVTLPLGEWAPVQARWTDNITPVTINQFASEMGPHPYELSTVDGLGNATSVGIKPLSSNRYSEYDYSTMVSTNAESKSGVSGAGFNNLWTNLSLATASTVNALRTSFALQKFFEAQARYGSRYIEYTQGVFGVTSSDARLQRSEYLGGVSTPINIDQVIQQSSTDNTSPLGNTGAFSYTPISDHLATYSAEEHGCLLVVACVRVEASYQQGIEKQWLHKKFTDEYNPFFAHLGEQPILSKEIYCDGTAGDDDVFGYQEAWAEYRYKPNYVTGKMRSNASGSLDSWHYADYYTERPRLSAEWLTGNSEPAIKRTLAVQDEPSFIGDFYFKYYHTRPMPVYSVPGLIDHV